jgi:hypothetical protein
MNNNEIVKGPVQQIPSNLLKDFTLNYTIPVVYNFHNDGTSALLEPVWTNDYLKSYTDRFTKQNIINNTHGNEPYGAGDLFDPDHGASYFFCKIFDKYDMTNKKIGIIGSTTPWLEAIVYNYNCTDITTIEYNKPIIENNKIFKSIKYSDCMNLTNEYDVIISYSSIEHSGLGRYGDDLDPKGDLTTMSVVHNILKKDGLLILGVPIGMDTLVWNANRIYGEIRLPLLINGFNVLEWFGGNSNCVFNIPQFGGKFSPQPILVCNKN